jgi:glycosyltransferase involved in cell wall biosynthesis
LADLPISKQVGFQHVCRLIAGGDLIMVGNVNENRLSFESIKVIGHPQSSIQGPVARPRYIFIAPWEVTPCSGVNSVILGLAVAMEPRYEPVIVVTSWSAPPPGQLWMRMPALSGSFRNLISYAIRFIPTMYKLRRQSNGAVAINAHYVGLELLPVVVARKLGLCPQVILSVHGADITAARQMTGWSAALFRMMLRCADTVVACSNSLAKSVRDFSPKANIVTVWNATRWPDPITEQRPMECPYLICVASFVKKKAHDILLPAFRRVLDEERAGLHLVLIGGHGPELLAIEKLVHSLGLVSNVTIICDVTTPVVWRWVRYAECFVLPSRDEPFGIALLEAGALGIPIVATRVGGVPEFITDGVSGILCEPENIEELASAILNSLRNYSESKKRAGVFQERVRDFTWDRSFEEYEIKAIGPSR